MMKIQKFRLPCKVTKQEDEKDETLVIDWIVY